jgi:hypothetical protein
VESFLHIFLHSQEHELLGLVLAHTFASPCLGHEPKARVATPKLPYMVVSNLCTLSNVHNTSTYSINLQFW